MKSRRRIRIGIREQGKDVAANAIVFRMGFAVPLKDRLWLQFFNVLHPPAQIAVEAQFTYQVARLFRGQYGTRNRLALEIHKVKTAQCNPYPGVVFVKEDGKRFGFHTLTVYVFIASATAEPKVT